MKTISIIVLVSVLCAGCSSTKVQGNGWSAQNNSFLWSRKNISGTISTNGSATFSEAESSPDSQSIAVLTQAVLQLAAQAK